MKIFMSGGAKGEMKTYSRQNLNFNFILYNLKTQ